jgi:5,10-methylenetetrahydromethanopterin reductase
VKPAQRPIVISPRFGLVEELTGRAEIAESLAVDEIWLEQQPDQRDSLVVAGAYLTHAPSATVGTAVLPVYTRHPASMAQAALTLADISDGRFVLGLGYSHQFINEYVLGHRQGPPIAVMREYLKIVTTLIDTGSVMREGQHFTARMHYVGTRRPTPLVLAGLRPQMIRLAVEFGEGLVLWLCTPRYIAERVTPVVERACAEFGKDPAQFRVISLLPTYTGEHAAKALEQFSQTVRAYRLIPHYRYVMEAYGEVDPAHLCMIGSADYIQERMAAFRAAGSTPVVSPLGDSFEEFSDAVIAAYGPPPG